MSIRMQCALAPFAAVLVAAAAAQDLAAESPFLSSGRAFAEQGGAAIYANVCAACHQLTRRAPSAPAPIRPSPGAAISAPPTTCCGS